MATVSVNNPPKETCIVWGIFPSGSRKIRCYICPEYGNAIWEELDHENVTEPFTEYLTIRSTISGNKKRMGIS